MKNKKHIERIDETLTLNYLTLKNKINEIIDYLSSPEVEEKVKSWDEALLATPPQTTESKGKCNGMHCKCMNLDKRCPNFHYRDHDCPFDKESGHLPTEPDQKSPKVVETTGDEWEKEFKKTFPMFITDEAIFGQDSSLYKDILSFITTLLKAERERVRGIVENLETIDGSITDGFKKVILTSLK